MKLKFDEKEGEVAVTLSRKFYRSEHLPQAAYVFAKQAEAFLTETPGTFEVTLKSRLPLDREGLRRLAGEFLNELISEERRYEVGRENKRIIELIVTQALYSATQTPEAEVEAARITEEMRPEAERLMAEIRAQSEGAAAHAVAEKA